MSKGLEAFYDLIKNQTITDEMITIEKELKALEIIKEHIKLNSFKYDNDETYGLVDYMFFISKEEYDLLKEVLL